MATGHARGSPNADLWLSGAASGLQLQSTAAEAGMLAQSVSSLSAPCLHANIQFRVVTSALYSRLCMATDRVEMRHCSRLGTFSVGHRDVAIIGLLHSLIKPPRTSSFMLIPERCVTYSLLG